MWVHLYCILEHSAPICNLGHAPTTNALCGYAGLVTPAERSHVLDALATGRAAS